MKAVVALALMAPLAACATLARHTTQNFTVESDPAGASVQTSNGLHCDATPCTFQHVKREAHFTVTVAHPGYVTQTANVTHTTSPAGAAAMAGTIALPGGLALSLIDANFGATQDLKPTDLKVTLAPLTAAAPVTAASAQ
ncbi:MAG: PEGA domain-containing protein [Alphaproteobacteria bacterium]